MGEVIPILKIMEPEAYGGKGPQSYEVQWNGDWGLVALDGAFLNPPSPSHRRGHGGWPCLRPRAHSMAFLRLAPSPLSPSLDLTTV